MKKNKLVLSLTALVLTLVIVTGCTAPKKNNATNSSSDKTTTSSSVEKVDLNSLDLPQLSTEVAEDEALVEMVTSEGTIKIKLFPTQAPKAVENFLTHAKAGYYNGVTFHRVIKDFMVQGGDPEGTGSGGASIWKEEFAPEISNQLYHLNGALAMARTSGDVTLPTQGSQFYIVQNETNASDGLLSEDYPEKIIEAYGKGGVPFLDFQYSVFGQVIEGLETVVKISDAEIDGSDKPTKDVTIKEVKILQEAK